MNAGRDAVVERTTPVSVREATVDDAAEVARLMNQFDGTSATAEQVAVRMQACSSFLAIWLGLLDGQVAGYACLRVLPLLQGDEPYAELTDLYIDEPFRRRGVARALLLHVSEVAQTAGAREILLITGFTNVAAQAAYRGAGYADYALAMRRAFPEPSTLGPSHPES
jgi:ribosomal protein S18 acetylase RimI-like enzyme